MSSDAKRKPRVVLLMQFYDPEPIYKGQAFAEAIARSGYDVEVVTGFPNYPGGKVYDTYRRASVAGPDTNSVQLRMVNNCFCNICQHFDVRTIELAVNISDSNKKRLSVRSVWKANSS